MFSFTDAVLEDRVQVITLKKADLKITQFSDLKGKRVGIQRGSSYGEQFEAALPMFQEDRDSSGDSRLNQLVAERIDAAVLSGGNTAQIQKPPAGRPVRKAAQQDRRVCAARFYLRREIEHNGTVRARGAQMQDFFLVLQTKGVWFAAPDERAGAVADKPLGKKFTAEA